MGRWESTVTLVVVSVGLCRAASAGSYRAVPNLGQASSVRSLLRQLVVFRQALQGLMVVVCRWLVAWGQPHFPFFAGPFFWSCCWKHRCCQGSWGGGWSVLSAAGPVHCGKLLLLAVACCHCRSQAGLFPWCCCSCRAVVTLRRHSLLAQCFSARFLLGFLAGRLPPATAAGVAAAAGG